MEVICIGHAAYDLTLVLDDYPAEDSKHEVDRWLEMGGGPAANAACLLGHWGTNVGFCGRVGQDWYGERIAKEFREFNVDVAQLDASDQATTPVSTIIVNRKNGSRTIINRAANISGCPLKTPPQVAPKVLLFDGHQLNASLEALDRFPDAISILDAGSVREGTVALAGKVDYLIASTRFALQWFNETELPDVNAACSRLAEIGRGVTAITLGDRGCVVFDKGNVYQLPAADVIAVDTTGAGDIFHGAFAYGCLKQMSTRDSLLLASQVAALSVCQLGGRNSIPDLQSVLTKLES